ncbi:MAG: hypothetical protein E7108_05830 [Bacteroidales bacterium]|jgi:hypothetical protein|nr:hypothetical protein [Bacteroidales bacterium]
MRKIKYKSFILNSLKQLIVVLLLLLSIRVVYSICIWGVNISRLKLDENTKSFDLDSLFNIDNNRISKKETISYRKKVICCNYIIDDKYYLSVFRAGYISDEFDWNKVYILDTLENIRNKYDYIINVPTSIFPKEKYVGVYFCSFNTTITSYSIVKEISLYINGIVYNKKMFNKDLMIIQASIGNAVFSLNQQKNKLDISFTYNPNYISPSFIIIKIEKDHQLFMCVTNYPIDI